MLKLDTLVWAHMYDDTVHEAASENAALSIARMIALKIEPEIVMKLKAPLAAGVSDPAAVLAAVDWIAIGFEIIDCQYPDWKFQPADFVAAYGLHAALVEEGSGRNALRSPALSLAELAAAAVRHGADEPLAASELISTGPLTSSFAVSAGEVSRAEVSGIDLSPLTVSL